MSKLMPLTNQLLHLHPTSWLQISTMHNLVYYSHSWNRHEMSPLRAGREPAWACLCLLLGRSVLKSFSFLAESLFPPDWFQQYKILELGIEREGPWLLRQWEQEPVGFLGYNQLHFSRTGGLMLSLALQPSASPLGLRQDQNVVQVFLQSGLSYCLGSDNTHLSLFVKLQQTWRNIRVEKWRDCWKPSPFRTIHPIGIKRIFHFN